MLTGLPAEGLVVETDDPNFAFGDDTSVVAVDACSGLEVPVVSGGTRFFVPQDVVECTVAYLFGADSRAGNGISALVSWSTACLPCIGC